MLEIRSYQEIMTHNMSRDGIGTCTCPKNTSENSVQGQTLILLCSNINLTERKISSLTKVWGSSKINLPLWKNLLLLFGGTIATEFG
jgi:hypothetical protein